MRCAVSYVACSAAVCEQAHSMHGVYVFGHVYELVLGELPTVPELFQFTVISFCYFKVCPIAFTKIILARPATSLITRSMAHLELRSEREECVRLLQEAIKQQKDVVEKAGRHMEELTALFQQVASTSSAFKP